MAGALVALAAAMIVLVSFSVSPAHAVGPTPEETWMTNGTVFDTQLSEDGKTLYVGGRFTVVKDRAGNKISRTNLVAIDVATGTVVRTWRPTATGGTKPLVRELAVKGGKVYVGGTFTTVNGAARGNLAAVDAATGAVDPNFAPNITTSNSTAPLVYALAVDDSKLYVGGRFNAVNGVNRPRLAAFNLATGALDNTWRPRANLEVMDLEFAEDGASIFAVGRFTSITGSDGVSATRKNVARLDTSTGNVHPWAIPDGVIGETAQTAHEALITPTRAYITFGDKGPNYVAAFRLDDGNTGSQIWRYHTVGDPQALALSPDGKRLFFGGHFGLVQLEQQVCGGQYLRGLASLNPNNGQLYCDWLPQIEPYRDNGFGPWDMTITDDTHLWVGGGFTGISGVPQSNLARFDLTAKSANYAKPKVDLNGLQRSSGLQRGGLNATYHDNIDFTGPEVTRIDPTINFDFGGGSPDPSMGPDQYSARWTGQIDAPVSGQYTFTTTSDDGVRLYIDGNLVVENWTNHAPTDDSGTVTLDAGRHDIRMDFYEDGGGALIRLAWEYPGQARQIVPANNLFYSADNVGGLDATYYDNMDFTGAQVDRVDPTVNFDFGNGSPDPSIGADTFSARWTGQVEAPVSGEYTFTTRSDDGVRLFVDGKLVVENWTDHGPTDDSGTITLEAGKRYDIQLDFYENGVGALIRLFWEYPGQARQVIPSGNLFYSGNVDYSATFAGGPTPIVDQNNLVVMDADDVNLRSATVTLTNRPNGSAETLSANTTGTPIVATYDAAQGVLGLSGKASKADYQKVLRTVRYNNTAPSPSGEDRRVTFVVNDGFDGSSGAVSTIAMQANTP